MKFTFKKCFSFKRFHHQNSDDVWKDIPEKYSLTHIILDFTTPPTYRLPRTINTVQIYKTETASRFALGARNSSRMSTSLTAAVAGNSLIGRPSMVPWKSSLDDFTLRLSHAIKARAIRMTHSPIVKFAPVLR